MSDYLIHIKENHLTFLRLKYDSLSSATKDFLFSVLSYSTCLSVFSSHPQLLLMSFNERPLFFCWGLKGIQLQSIKSVAAIPKRIWPTNTPTTSIVVSDSCPIEGSYKFFLYECFYYRNSFCGHEVRCRAKILFLYWFF